MNNDGQVKVCINLNFYFIVIAASDNLLQNNSIKYYSKKKTELTIILCEIITLFCYNVMKILFFFLYDFHVSIIRYGLNNK